MSDHQCRGCSAPLYTVFADLGRSPLSNALVSLDRVDAPQATYPLRVYVCNRCFLVQLPYFADPFVGDYPYFSSTSASWVEHHRRHARHIQQWLKPKFVVDVGSNDGYLLQHFDCKRLGVDPSRNVALAAEKKGVPTDVKCFTPAYARHVLSLHGLADFINATNVLAHVPKVHDFIEAFRILLAPEGVATFEFPHIGQLMDRVQLDTIYHEHFSYWSLYALEPILRAHGLRAFEVDCLLTHGGSLRVYVCHETASYLSLEGYTNMQHYESCEHYDSMDAYKDFASRCVRVKCELLSFLIDCAAHRERVVGYGAPAKATTLFNYCGIGPELLAFTVDDAPSKQDKLIPGCGVPIYHPAMLNSDSANVQHVLVLAWNLVDELLPKILKVLPQARIWTAIPGLTQHRR